MSTVLQGSESVPLQLRQSRTARYQRGWRGRGAGHICLVRLCCSRGSEFINWKQLQSHAMETVGRGADSPERWKERMSSGTGPGDTVTRRKTKKMEKLTTCTMELGVVCQQRLCSTVAEVGSTTGRKKAHNETHSSRGSDVCLINIPSSHPPTPTLLYRDW